ncbi:MAG: hypothetical protein QM733_06395 [Ilumatobacteraceae bacterium]
MIESVLNTAMIGAGLPSGNVLYVGASVGATVVDEVVVDVDEVVVDSAVTCGASVEVGATLVIEVASLRPVVDGDAGSVDVTWGDDFADPAVVVPAASFDVEPRLATTRPMPKQATSTAAAAAHATGRRQSGWLCGRSSMSSHSSIVFLRPPICPHRRHKRSGDGNNDAVADPSDTSSRLPSTGR